MLKRVALFMLLASPAFAQTQPITLSPQEFEQVVHALAQRDPVVALLLQKEQAAQSDAVAAAAKKTEPPKDPDK